MFTKSVVIFVFLASVVIIPCWSLFWPWSKPDNPNCPDAGIKENAALSNLLNDDKEIYQKVRFGEGCHKDMKEQAETKDFDPNVKVVYDQVCYAVGFEKNEEYDILLPVYVLSKTKEEIEPQKSIQSTTAKDCANKKPYQSLYLPQLHNKNTYMILNPKKAVLFFTTKLSGCDIFIAENPSKPNQTLVVHSNKNEAKDEAQNLKWKGDDVDEILQTSAADYKVFVRVYHKPDDENNQKIIAEYKKNHNQAEMVEYNISAKPIQPFHFIGFFEKNGWNFFLKGAIDGKIIWRKCLNRQSHCGIF